MYDEFINIFKANNIPFEEHFCETEKSHYRVIELESGKFFFDEYDEFTKAIDDNCLL